MIFEIFIFAIIMVVFGSLGYAIGTPVSGIIIGLIIASLATIPAFRGWVWGSAGVRKLAGILIAIAVAITLINIAIAIWSLNNKSGNRFASQPKTAAQRPATAQPQQQPIIICVTPPPASASQIKKPAPRERIIAYEQPIRNDRYQRSRNDWRYRNNNGRYNF